ncbi:outer membrane receptor protein involved in Fe transport [Polymorphobacter fuscus]|nr:outer membrane receptor protein involved in Fe transport [Polymorphobacter fuscus]
MAPAMVRAQSAAPPAAASPPAADVPAEESVDISIPGANEDIVVTGRRNANIAKSVPQVVSVLSSADIARTGEGDIAGALSHVTGLSVVGNGFVYVRGLGDRYSLALLNGSPLPSPEPLRRVVPLDLFPTSVISSTLVQKSYSVNFPGEFGGGVINLTTKAIPQERFITIGGAIGGDTVTTNGLGYTYFGSPTDPTGFDNGTRSTPPALAAYLASGERISTGAVDTKPIAGELVNARNALVQRNRHIPANTSATLTAGDSYDVGNDGTLGVIATLGYSNTWRTRDAIQQTASSADLSQKELDFQRVITDNRIIVNGLLGVGYEWDENKLRWTNLFIRDTLKQARIGIGQRATGAPNATLQQQDTAWYARQLFNTQLTGEFELTPELSLDMRGAYANSRRDAPAELSFEYLRSNSEQDPFGAQFINRLNNGQQGLASATYSKLNENLWSGGADLSYKPIDAVTATLGYAYSDTSRRTERREFQFIAPSDFPRGVAMLRPDLLLQPSVIDYYNIALVDVNEANPVFDARLRIHGAYGQIQAELTPTLSLNAGVRYETAKQTVTPVQVFKEPTASLAETLLDRSYWLPAATLTWELADRMQVRLNASKTLARPQFRELIFQNYFDPESNRLYRGNPLLTDSQLFNAEARYEWYFGTDEQLSVAGFFKRIDNPIESFVSFSDNLVITSFANAPKADLYGVELETQKYFDLADVGKGAFWASRRALLIANYTYTQSKLKVGPNDPVAVFASAANLATDYFRDGAPLTGQSDHLVNLQFGLQDSERLSQQTFLLSYASNRVTSRGGPGQPDIIEKPGFRLDFVARQGIEVSGKTIELKLEVRNITATKNQEFQQSGDNRIFFNLWDVGVSGSIGASINF